MQVRAEAALTEPDQCLASVLDERAAYLRADGRWIPGRTELERGRAIIMTLFDRPTNLLLQEFAALAGKSRQQIYKDIDSRLLLALNVGPKCLRLPDWQLDDVKRRMTQEVLAVAKDVDDWTVFRVLSQPLDALGARAPIDAVTAESVQEVICVVVNALGLQIE